METAHCEVHPKLHNLDCSFQAIVKERNSEFIQDNYVLTSKQSMDWDGMHVNQLNAAPFKDNTKTLKECIIRCV